MNRLLAVVAVLWLAGCTGPPPAAPAAPFESSAEAAAAPAPAMRPAELASQEVLAGSAQPVAFQVVVPPGARNLTVSGSYTLATLADIRVEVSGCGAIGEAVVRVALVGQIEPTLACALPAPGEQEATVTVLGQYVGSITITAQVPAHPGSEHGDVQGSFHLRRPLPIDPRA